MSQSDLLPFHKNYFRGLPILTFDCSLCGHKRELLLASIDFFSVSDAIQLMRSYFSQRMNIGYD